MSGATHYASKELLSVALNIPPLAISYTMIAVKFLAKALTSDYHMQGLILQLEESRTHRYHQHIDMILQYLAWKGGSSNLTRSRIKLISSIDDLAHYSKEDMSQYEDHLWKLHLNQHNCMCTEEQQIAISLDEISRTLLPRDSSRKTDTKVISLLHGHDLCFTAFKARILDSGQPNCSTCPTLKDDNAHRIFSCPLFRCSYRDSLLHLNDHERSAGWSILACDDKALLNEFRNLAQIAVSY